ncbi:hypothetical protein CIB48_g10534 [Xylaria polymorpha]|nr:hypothetical protein CIB48_g10534 [Xylaria polymorpha]
MANQGDLNLARQLQAEFGRSKPSKSSKRKARRVARVDYENIQAPSAAQYQGYHQPPPPRRPSQQVTYDLNRGGYGGGHRGRGGRIPTTSRPAWEGKLATNDSPGKVFPILLSVVTKIFIRIYSGTFRTPLHQKTNQDLPEAVPKATSSTPTVTLQGMELLHAQRTEEQEDIEMGEADYPLPEAPKPTTANPRKGLSSSMWNPANENGRASSVGSSQASFKPRSRTPSSVKEVEIVTSGLTKGPGLRASR